MALYESNYLRLAGLAGELRALHGLHVSEVADDCDLRLTVTERTPYTTSFDLTYVLGPDQRRFGADVGVVATGATRAPAALGGDTYPDMSIRIYHDARLVEALQWADAHGHPHLRAWRSTAERELDQRWARNTMLNKWLEYCSDRGHVFRA
jgi:uncharacterized protein YqiB (DUF1249 family)